jgi:2-phosphosulfolactate phosphatase
MDADVVLLPGDLRPAHLDGRLVVVFDVLRATTSMAAALAAGVSEIRVFGSLDAARAAAGDAGDDWSRLLCGEENCLPPPGFDLGNSPGAFTPALHAGRVVYMSTTNGTRAIVAAREAPVVLTGALVNAGAVARAIAESWPGLDLTLLCAGTGGAVALEDVVGAGAVLHALDRLVPVVPATDVAVMASTLFGAVRDDLRGALAASRGGRNVVAAGLAPDIDFAARLDALDVVGVVERQALSIRGFTAEKHS